ncbi:a62a6593-7799-4251-9c60-5b27326d13f3 [Sclerotinia trifoliorum]|uniref:A62a6593-7799-4251-9c60-5b27326d13f3 n=1 Tax=Sclerotinia trifoliorum TaxID=28548 RepID=A0A8H2ZML5_9HELO|nr:a62a6593-7799-4251-9c60-5b27326d13f3 [Sclerotinia trifoliorum]
MSHLTLKPGGLLDDQNRYWYQRFPIDHLEHYKRMFPGLPFDFVSYLSLNNGWKYFPRGFNNYNPPQSANAIFANFKQLATIKGNIDRVYDLNRQLKGIFRTYATEARGKYDTVLDIIAKIGAEISDDAPLNASDLETLRGIVQARSDLSTSMKTIVSAIINLLHGIKNDLETAINNINADLLALNKVLVFSPAEQDKIDEGPTPDNIWGFGEKFALVDTYFVINVNDAVTRAQDAITFDISPAITMMETEFSNWDAISHDLATVLQDVENEKNDKIAELELLDNDAILEAWQNLGDIVVQDSELDY